MLKQDVCKQWVARDEKIIAPTQHLSYFPLVVDSGSGSIIRDVDGNEYIDFLTSASSLNLGSSNPLVTEAIKAQLEKCTQYTVAYTYNVPMIEYAERLASVYPGLPSDEVRVLFGNCGSDGNDAAIKFTRAFTGRSKIITFFNAYHGNTYGSSSLTTVSSRMRDGMGPFLGDIYHFPFHSADEPDMPEEYYVSEMLQAFDTYLPPEEVASVIIEPIQGDGGLILAHPKFMSALYKLCKEHGILFISEEVQQGFWRAGHWFGIENFPGIVPDGVIMGKSVGAGLTLGGFMGRKDMMECLPAPAHLFTLGGNAVACAAGIAAFDYYSSEEFRELRTANEALMAECLKEMCDKHPDVIGFIRGTAMSRGLGVIKKGEDGEPVADDQGTFKILYRAYERGLLIISVAGNILRIQPPLNIEPEKLREGFDILDQAITDFENDDIPDSVFEFQRGW